MRANERLEQIERKLEELAGRGRTVLRVNHEPKQRADFIEHGSPEHAQFLGLVELTTDADRAEAEAAGRVTYTDPRDKRGWALGNEEDAIRFYPSLDYEAAVRRTIISKLSSLNSGVPSVSPDAKPLWRPNDAYEAMLALGMNPNETLVITEPGNNSILGV